MSRQKGRRALALCAAMLFTLCGCAGAPGGETSASPTATAAETVTTKPTTPTVAPTKKAETITPALCFDKSDSLSPYEAKTRVNRALAPLLYEGLTRVEAGYTASLCLAEKIEKTDKTHLTVTLKKGVRFSDKSSLKAADVAASFLLAARSESYADLVADVAAVTAKGERTLAVTFASSVPFYEAALSFPVVKTGKDTCVGTGVYCVNKKKTALSRNPYSDETAGLETLALENISRAEQMQFALETGTVCIYGDDLSSGSVPHTVTNVTLTPVTLPYLVYLGFNANREPWSKASIRVSLSDALCRTDVAAVGFSGYAVPAATPFCPALSSLKEVAGAELTADAAKAVSVWKKNGYNVSEKGTVKHRLSATLICQKQNAMHKAAAEEIAKELRAAGMQVSVKALSDGDYRSRLSSGDYDLYLGEVRLPDTLSLDAVLTGAGGAAYGISAGGYALWSQYKSGALSTEKFVAGFMKEMPFVPLCYAQGLTLSSARLSGVLPRGTDLYGDTEQWIFT